RAEVAAVEELREALDVAPEPGRRFALFLGPGRHPAVPGCGPFSYAGVIRPVQQRQRGPVPALVRWASARAPWPASGAPEPLLDDRGGTLADLGERASPGPPPDPECQ